MTARRAGKDDFMASVCYFLNADQCLEMSNYDFFFFKYQTEKKLCIDQITLRNDSEGSLKRAFAGISRLEAHGLDKLHIVAAVRSTYNAMAQAERWDDTIMALLLKLRKGLEDAGIHLANVMNLDVLLTVFLFYDSRFEVGQPGLHPYAEDRFGRDMELLFREIGIDPDETPDTEGFRARAKEYAQKSGHDAALSRMLDLVVKDDVDGMPDPGTQLRARIREQIDGIQLFEDYIHTSAAFHVRDLLSMVEYLTEMADISDRGAESGDGAVRMLRNISEQTWTKISQRRAGQPEAGALSLEDQYRGMLGQYYKRLKSAQVRLGDEISRLDTQKEEFPPLIIPPESTIGDSVRGGDDGDGSGELGAALDDFLKELSPGRAKAQWETASSRISGLLEKMENGLKQYAEMLSGKFSGELDRRRLEAEGWEAKIQNYRIAGSYPEISTKLNLEENTCYETLREPGMEPSLMFNDQLNMENELARAGEQIRYYAGCLDTLSVRAFLFLVLLLGAYGLVHHFFLQPYIFQNASGFAAVLTAAAASALFMLTAWAVPSSYYRRMIRKNVRELKDSIRTYGQGYTDKRDNLRRSVNVLNRLNYILCYKSMLEKVCERTSVIGGGYRWHLAKVTEYMKKVETCYFDLLNWAPGPDTPAPDSSSIVLPEVRANKLALVPECPLYWPQAN